MYICVFVYAYPGEKDHASAWYLTGNVSFDGYHAVTCGYTQNVDCCMSGHAWPKRAGTNSAKINDNGV